MSIMQKSLTRKPLRASLLFTKFDLFEADICIQINRWAHNKDIRTFFLAISRLGDGVFWYCALGLYVLVHFFQGPALIEAGIQELIGAVIMSAIGITSVIIYKVIKGTMVRERPFISFGEITAHTAPLDRYSFPSGHTMNAMCFVSLFNHYEPSWLLVILPFAILVGMSRVILGMHYISDVIVGAVLGLAIAQAGLALV